MKSVLAILLGSFLLSSANAATPLIYGAISGGGGKGIVCLDKSGEVASVELLDLWEARVLYGHTIQPSLGTVASDVNQGLVRLKNAYPFRGSGGVDGEKYSGQDFLLALMQQTAANFQSPNPKVLRLRGIELDHTDDSFEVAKPANCQIRQLVNYMATGKILVDQDYYEKLDTINQAALIVHEAMYHFLREMASETNSVRTRRAVGYVFGGNTFNLPINIVSGNPVRCFSEELDIAGNVIGLARIAVSEPDHVGLAIELSALEGSQLIGIPQDATQFKFKFKSGFPVDDLLSGTCNGNYLWTIGIALSGPVEYDRQIKLRWICHGKSPKLILMQTLPGVAGEKRSELKCDWPTP